MSNNVLIHVFLCFIMVGSKVISVAAILEFTITGLIVENPAWQAPYLDLGHGSNIQYIFLRTGNLTQLLRSYFNYH